MIKIQVKMLSKNSVQQCWIFLLKYDELSASTGLQATWTISLHTIYKAVKCY